MIRDHEESKLEVMSTDPLLKIDKIINCRKFYHNLSKHTEWIFKRLTVNYNKRVTTRNQEGKKRNSRALLIEFFIDLWKSCMYIFCKIALVSKAYCLQLTPWKEAWLLKRSHFLCRESVFTCNGWPERCLLK